MPLLTIVWGYGGDWIPGNAVNTPVVYDFPVLYPLCRAREVRGDLVRFCLCPAGHNGLCHAHSQWRDAGEGEWDGFEVVWRSKTPVKTDYLLGL